jgi:hypothetical protein
MDTNSALSPQQARSGPNRRGSRKPSTRTRIQKLVARHGDGEHLLGLRFPLGKDGVVHGRPDPPCLVDLNLHETYNSNRISKNAGRQIEQHAVEIGGNSSSKIYQEPGHIICEEETMRTDSSR